VLAGGGAVVTALASGCGFGGGTQAGQARVPGSGADLSELIPDVSRCPAGFEGVGVAQVRQPPVRHPADIGPIDGAEG
jgi:hypothetical protein